MFLGILLNGDELTLVIPCEKRIRALVMLQLVGMKCKVKAKDLQSLCGYLNFLCRAIVPGRTFTRCMYNKYSQALQNKTQSGAYLSDYHHVHLDAEFRFDCKIWQTFLESENPSVVNRPMIDLSLEVTSEILHFYSDASANAKLGFGCLFGNEWIFQQWEPDFIDNERPSIEFLELYGLCAGIFTWENKLKNFRFTVFCDNRSVVDMINAGVSRCRNCMYLLRLLALNNLQFNRRLFARHVFGACNKLVDSLSRLKIAKFKSLAPLGTKPYPECTSEKIWPLTKLWRLSNSS